MRILVIEDDEEQAQDLEEALRKEFRSIEFTRVELEQDFVQRFEELAETGFDLAVVDVMLEWADPSPQPTRGPGPYDEAGFRCRARLKQDPRTVAMPVIMLSVLRRDIPSDIDYVVKTQDFRELVQRAKTAVKQPR